MSPSQDGIKFDVVTMKSIGIFLGIEPYAGGMFQYAQSLLNALVLMHNQVYEVHVAYVSPSWEQVLVDYPFRKKRLTSGKFGLLLAKLVLALHVPAKFSRLFSSVSNPITIQLSQLECDLWIFPSQDAIAYQTKLTSVISVHDLMHRYEPSFPEVSGRGRGIIRERRLRNLVSWGHTILVDSEVGKQHVIDSYGADPEKIFPLPYVPPSHIFRTPESSQFDRQYKLPKKFILYPAQFWEHKNHKRLIKAASIVKSAEPDISLVFTGGKNKSYADIRAFTRVSGMEDSVAFMGHVPDEDMAGFYKRARAMIMPTFFGPTNIPPLEAFVCGCPVAVSNIYGMPDQLGDAALFFDPNSVDEIADVIKRLWKDDHLCRQLIAKGHQETKKWGQEQFAGSLHDILLKVGLL